VFYHDFGRISVPAQLLLTTYAHSPTSRRAALLSTKQVNTIILMLVLVAGVKVLQSWWRAACRTVKPKPSAKTSRNSHPRVKPRSATVHAPPKHSSSLSSLTDTDKETDKETGSSYNSLQEPLHGPLQPMPLQAQHTLRRLRRRSKDIGVVDSLEDRECLGSGCWDPFASSSW